MGADACSGQSDARGPGGSGAHDTPRKHKGAGPYALIPEKPGLLFVSVNCAPRRETRTRDREHRCLGRSPGSINTPSFPLSSILSLTTTQMGAAMRPPMPKRVKCVCVILASLNFFF